MYMYYTVNTYKFLCTAKMQLCLVCYDVERTLHAIDDDVSCSYMCITPRATQYIIVQATSERMQANLNN